jgi:hypothetical protein
MRTKQRPTLKRPHWYHAETGEVHESVFEYVADVERKQFATYNRFVQLEVLYDPNAANSPSSVSLNETPGLVIENVIASNVDTVTAQIAASDIRARFMTDDGDWSTQRQAKQLEWYAEGLGKRLEINEACQRAFKSAAKKGTGVVKVYVDQFDEIKVEYVRVDDIVVDEAECRNGGYPRQMHRRMSNVDREDLKSMFPDKEDAIERAQTGRSWSRMWADYRPVADGELVVIESHKLPVGRKGHDGYRCGRHTICVDGATLLDEDYEKPHFPYVCVHWSEREAAFYGISLSEGIAGIQRALNKRNLQIDRNLDQYAFPTTYVGMADANLAVQTINRIGSVVVVRGERPTTVTPQAVSPEVYQNRLDMKMAASENSGVSRMASQAMKPAGIDSGVGMREYRDQTTQRFAMQEKAFERLVLDVYLLALECCKELGADAPVIMRKAKFGARKIKWSDVDMGDVAVQIAAASTLSRTPSGRLQTALEWAQAGVITPDEWRKIVDHPDLDRILSLYTQGMESIERDIEAIEDGYVVAPEPFGNLELMTRMGQMAYLRDRDLDAPEDVLEGLRQYVVLAADMLTPAQPPAADNAAPMAPEAMPPGAMPLPPGAPPMAFAS